MDDISAIAGKTNPELESAYRSLNRDWSDMNIIRELTQEQADKVGGGALERIKQALGVRGLLIAQVANNTGANKALAASAAVRFNQVVNDPKTSNKMAKGLKVVSDHLEINPDSPFLKRLVIAAQVSSYDPNDGNESLRKSLSSVSAEIQLQQQPIQRTYNDIERKSDQILEALEYHNPDMAKQLRQAFKHENKDAVGQLIQEMGKMPALKEIIADGVGIDGKVWSQEDKQMLSDQVDGMDISLKQKLELKRNLRINGTVPVVQAEPDRFMKFQSRDKSRPKY
jgi:hypothetical protein